MKPSLTVEQVAELVACHPETVRREIARGNLDAWKPGASDWRIEPDDLAEWKRRKKSRKPTSRLRALEGKGA